MFATFEKGADVPLWERLLRARARVQAFDPQAKPVAKRIFGNKITLADKSYSALKGADALVIATEWNEFREPDFARMKKLLAILPEKQREILILRVVVGFDYKPEGTELLL